MNQNKKLLAVVAIALMLSTPLFSAAITEDSDASSSEYHIYMTTIDSSDKVTYEGWISFESASTFSSYASAATKAVQSALSEKGLKFASEVSLGDSGWWSSPENYWAACYTVVSNAWSMSTDPVSEFSKSNVSAVFLVDSSVYYNHFYLESLPAGASASDYLYNVDPYMGAGYHLLPSVAPDSYVKNAGFGNYLIIGAVVIVALLVVLILVFSMRSKKRMSS